MSRHDTLSHQAVRDRGHHAGRHARDRLRLYWHAPGRPLPDPRRRGQQLSAPRRRNFPSRHAFMNSWSLSLWMLSQRPSRWRAPWPFMALHNPRACNTRGFYGLRPYPSPALGDIHHFPAGPTKLSVRDLARRPLGGNERRNRQNNGGHQVLRHDADIHRCLDGSKYFEHCVHLGPLVRPPGRQWAVFRHGPPPSLVNGAPATASPPCA